MDSPKQEVKMRATEKQKRKWEWRLTNTSQSMVEIDETIRLHWQHCTEGVVRGGPTAWNQSTENLKPKHIFWLQFIHSSMGQEDEKVKFQTSQID